MNVDVSKRRCEAQSRGFGNGPPTTIYREVQSFRASRVGVAPGQLGLHADRGSSMISKTVAQLLADLRRQQDAPFRIPNVFSRSAATLLALPPEVWINPPQHVTLVPADQLG
jgi:hypothetical protein